MQTEPGNSPIQPETPPDAEPESPELPAVPGGDSPTSLPDPPPASPEPVAEPAPPVEPPAEAPVATEEAPAAESGPVEEPVAPAESAEPAPAPGVEDVPESGEESADEPTEDGDEPTEDGDEPGDADTEGVEGAGRESVPEAVSEGEPSLDERAGAALDVDAGPNWMLVFVCAWSALTALNEMWHLIGKLGLGWKLAQDLSVVGYGVLGVGLLGLAGDALEWGRHRRTPASIGLSIVSAILTLAGVICLVLSQDPGRRI